MLLVNCGEKLLNLESNFINVGDDDSITLADIKNKVPYGAKAMEKKVFYDKQQQEKEKFKIRHN